MSTDRKRGQGVNQILYDCTGKVPMLLDINEKLMKINGVKVYPLNQQGIANQVPYGKPKLNQLLGI